MREHAVSTHATGAPAPPPAPEAYMLMPGAAAKVHAKRVKETEDRIPVVGTTGGVPAAIRSYIETGERCVPWGVFTNRSALL
jgi:hypothetical protein